MLLEEPAAMPSAMSREEDFLQAILADPSAQDTWLVLADWLEENGLDSRAELLRLQIRLRSEPNVRLRSPLEKRVRELLASGIKPCAPSIENSVGMRLVLIPPGLFWMGSRAAADPPQTDEVPRHLVRITRPFFLGATPVTQEQYEAVTGSNPSYYRPGGPASDEVKGHDTRRWPVESVSYNDIQGFLALLSAHKAEKKAGRVYRLPTEAEWEYAARGCICLSAYHFGTRLRHADALFGRRTSHPRPVGLYPPNLFGLHDVHGTIWEWVNDWYDPDYYSRSPENDPQGPRRGSRRVLRGGGWSTGPGLCRSALRGHNTLDARHDYNGFRVALTPPPTPPPPEGPPA
jgi:uncharacterized protein (TIGR02996 family)